MEDYTLNSKKISINCDQKDITTSARIYDRKDFEFVLDFMRNNKDFKYLFQDIKNGLDNNYCFDMEVKLTWSKK